MRMLTTVHFLHLLQWPCGRVAVWQGCTLRVLASTRLTTRRKGPCSAVRLQEIRSNRFLGVEFWDLKHRLISLRQAETSKICEGHTAWIP